MAIVTVRWMTGLAWCCKGCGAQFPTSGPPHDETGSIAASQHSKECKSDMHIGSKEPWLIYTLEPPHGRSA